MAMRDFGALRTVTERGVLLPCQCMVCTVSVSVRCVVAVYCCHPGHHANVVTLCLLALCLNLFKLA